jgi:hypothetical protein
MGMAYKYLSMFSSFFISYYYHCLSSVLSISNHYVSRGLLGLWILKKSIGQREERKFAALYEFV